MRNFTETTESYIFNLFHELKLPYKKWLYKNLLEDINKMNISILSSIGKLNYSNQREKLIIKGTRALQYYFTGYRTFDTDIILLSGNIKYVEECVKYIKNQLEKVEYTSGINFEFLDKLNNDKNTRKITLKYRSYKNDGTFLYLNLFDCFFKGNKKESYSENLEIEKNEKLQLLFYFPTIYNIQKDLKSAIEELENKRNLLHNENQIDTIIRKIENLQNLHSNNDNEFQDMAEYRLKKFSKKLNDIGTSKIYRNNFLKREDIRLKKPAQTQEQKKIQQQKRYQERMKKLDEALLQAQLKTQKQEHMKKLDKALLQAQLKTQKQRAQEQKRGKPNFFKNIFRFFFKK